jgi:hypothetical protein
VGITKSFTPAGTVHMVCVVWVGVPPRGQVRGRSSRVTCVLQDVVPVPAVGVHCGTPKFGSELPHLKNTFYDCS